MIERFQCLPKLFTRRGFSALIGGAALSTLATRVVQAADPDFTIVVIPDPQFLAPFHACGPYSALMNWIVSNMSTTIDGSSLNIKAVVGVGDCVNTPNTGEASTAATAYGILDSNSIPWITPPGNHDYVPVAGNDLSTRNLATNFQSGGFFAADTRSSKSYYGGSYDTSGGNYYTRLTVGARRLLFLSLEYHPRSAVMDWAKGIHDANPGYEVIVTTHSYLTSLGNQVARGSGNTATNYWGPDGNGYNQGAAPASNAGTEMWSGWFSGWSRLTMILSGHWLWNSTYGGGWVWQRTQITSGSARAQAVQQIFTNQQDGDNGYNYDASANYSNVDLCTAGNETQHLFLLKFLPSLNKLRAYSLSVNTGNWIGATSAGLMTNASPVRLFDVNYTGIPSSLFPLPNALVH